MKSSRLKKPEDKNMLIEIMDTTLRDGEQTQGISFSPLEKLHLASFLLNEVKVDRIEIEIGRASCRERV